MNMRTITLTAFFCLLTMSGFSQIGDPFKGEETDTIYFVQLDSFSITARTLNNYNYSRYEAIVKKVYPYADTAIQTIKALESMQFDKRKDEKDYKKKLEDQLRSTFEQKLKNLSRTQGAVLIDIIERNTGKSMYTILKETKSSGSAFWWNNLSKVYGYDLKEGYDPKADPTLEEIIAAYEKKYKKK